MGKIHSPWFRVVVLWMVGLAVILWPARACLAGPAAPVLFLPFDERGGGLARDASGNQNDGVLHGPRWGDGRQGGALLFGGAGSDSYVEVPDTDELQLAHGFTFQFWWKKESRDVQIFFRKGAGRHNCYAYLEGGLHLSVTGTDGKVYTAIAPAPPDGWHHLAFTWDGREMAILVDGEKAGSQAAAPPALFTDESPLLIGTHSPGYKFPLAGALDDLGIWDTALPPERLDEAMAAARRPVGAAAGVQTFAASRGGLVLAKDGRPGATIVVRKGAGVLQRAPALELRRYLFKITGARLPIQEENQPVRGNLVLVGESGLSRRMGLSGSALEGDAFRIRAVPGRLVLLGHDASLGAPGASVTDAAHCKWGTANAVHAFLQDLCGVRWFLPGKLGEYVPRQRTLEVPAMDRREQPARTYALGSSLWGGDAGVWARRNLLGSARFVHHSGGHLWYSLISAGKYADTHPEWFALREDGSRSSDGNHLCTTNREIRAEALANLKALFDKGYEWVELGQTDGYQRCRCAACEAMDDYRDPSGYWVPGRPADRIHVFHAALAEEVAKAYPGRKVVIIAYGPTGEVPRRLDRFPENVVVEFTHDPPALLQRWGRFHRQFTAYVYWFGLSHPLGYAPKSSPAYVASEMRRMRAAGAGAFYFCGGGECWAVEAPSYYVLAQLQRRPGQSEAALLREFCRGLFGPAAPPMERFFTAFLGAADRYHRMSAIPVEPGAPFRGKPLSPEQATLACFDQATLDRCAVLLDKAAAAAPDDPARRRIRYFRDGFHYVRLTAAAFRCAADQRKVDTEASRAALRNAVQQRETLVRDILARSAAAGADLPPPFRGSVEDLLGKW